MTDLREVAKLALKVLQNKCDSDHEAIAALKRALAEDISQERVDTSEEQRHEPVAWIYRGNLHEFDPSDWATEPITPLYTHPQQCPNCTSLMEQNTELDKKLAEWVELTEEEIEKCKFDSLNGTGWSLNVDINLFYKSVEAKLKEKNT